MAVGTDPPVFLLPYLTGMPGDLAYAVMNAILVGLLDLPHCSFRQLPNTSNLCRRAVRAFRWYLEWQPPPLLLFRSGVAAVRAVVGAANSVIVDEHANASAATYTGIYPCMVRYLRPWLLLRDRLLRLFPPTADAHLFVDLRYY